MLIDQILLHIFQKLSGERTVNAAFHLLKGKRSGQTIQDVGLFKLYPFFGLLRKLSKQTYDGWIAELVARQLLIVKEMDMYELTEAGKVQQELPFFDGWHYRGAEHVFFARLSLIVQALSYQSARVNAFLPVQRNEQVQAWCRRFLIDTNYQQASLQQVFLAEITETLQVANLTEQQREIVLARLSGATVSGLTWQQIALRWELSELDVQLYFISGLHAWLEEIHTQEGTYLARLASGVRVENVLTGSANETAQLYAQGYSLEQIRDMRRLKLSTIEDHLVELALFEPAFQIRPFLSEADEQAVFEIVGKLGTKRLKVLRDHLPHLSYFQLRLALTKGG